MLKLTVTVTILLSISGVLCWKPLKASPTSYTITQHHPSLAQSHNTIADAATAGSSLDSHHPQHTITYHGNAFLNDHSHEHNDGSYIHSDDHYSGSGLTTVDDDVEGRVLSGHGSYYGSSGFNGLLGGSVGPAASSIDGHCSVNKYALEHEGTVQYDHTLPKLDQFTICAWMRFTNHSGDHTVFTYAVDDEPREIQFWIANAKGASYFSLAVHGQSLYRLNYPLKMRKWHHACTSWNGKTGEWQLWIKAERVGRGFHNRIVGYKIQPHGILFSGGPSITGPVADEIHLEVTMLQIYKVALSAGKAHRDHKHHHVHHFDHDGLATSTAAPPAQLPMQPVQPVNSLLANGQIATRLRINLAGVQPNPEQPAAIGAPAISQQATIGTEFVGGQFSPAERFISQQLIGSQIQQTQQLQQPSTFAFPDDISAPTSYAQIGEPSNVQYLDGTDGSHILYKRNNKRQKIVQKRETKKDKRALVTLTDGTVIDDRIIAENPFDFDGLASFGAPAFQQNLNKMMDIEDEIKHHDREPAEGEVQAVLNLCSACDTEPFEGAVILAWNSVKVKTEHVLRGKSLGGCGQF